MQTFHGTVVDIAGVGVLLRGPSGSGKSDLALRLIDRGAVLVADDRFTLRGGRRGPVAQAPERICGLLEVRGLGLLSLPAIRTCRLGLIVDLVPMADVPRLPDLASEDIVGHSVPKLTLHAFEPSAPVKVELAASQETRYAAGGPNDE